MPRASLGPRPSFSLCLTLALAVLGCSGYSRAVKDGDAFAQQKKWADADAAYSRALAIEPGESEAKLKLRSVRQTWSAEVYQEATRVQADLGATTKLLVRALALDPENARARGLLEKTLHALVVRGQVALDAERLPDALADFEAVLAVSPKDPAARRGKFGVQAAWAQRWFRRGEELERGGKLGNALLAYLRADQERAGATPARERAEVMRRKLRDEVTFFVFANPVVDRSNSPDVALRLAPGRLAASLPTKLPIRVVAEPPKSTTGVKLQLALERVLALKDKEVSQRSQRYLAGNRAVPNPKRAGHESKLLEAERTLEQVERSQDKALREYLAKQVEVRAARDAAERCRDRALRDCRETMAECTREAAEARQKGKPAEPCDSEKCEMGGCAEEEQGLAQRLELARAIQSELEDAQDRAELQRREVQRARDTVFREPTTVEEPMYSDFVYDVELHRLTVKASVTAVVEDLATPESAAAPNTYDFSITHEDVSHRGYDRYGVLADPVQLKNELELRQQAGDKAITELARRVKARFDSYRQLRVSEARRGMVRPQAEDVVETAVRALLLTADAPPPDILQPIVKARGIANPQALFGL